MSSPSESNSGRWRLTWHGYLTKHVILPVVIVARWGNIHPKVWQSGKYNIQYFLNNESSAAKLLMVRVCDKQHWHRQRHCQTAFPSVAGTFENKDQDTELIRNSRKNNPITKLAAWSCVCSILSIHPIDWAALPLSNSFGGRRGGRENCYQTQRHATTTSKGQWPKGLNVCPAAALCNRSATFLMQRESNDSCVIWDPSPTMIENKLMQTAHVTSSHPEVLKVRYQ